MSNDPTPKDREIQPCLDDSHMPEGGIDQPAGSSGTPMANLIAKVPSMALLAAAFFATIPDVVTDTLHKPM